jgi:hypothetical protein
MTDHVVCRASPDWPSFDLEETRPFLRGWADETLIIDFVTLWDGTFGVDYRSLRQRLKVLSLENFAQVQEAQVTPLADFDAGAVSPDDRIVFIDDDDWLTPDLFARLGDAPAEAWVWGSVRIGLDFGAPVPEQGEVLTLRPVDGYCYTNNYAVSGALLARHGLDALLNHGEASGRLAEAASRTQRLESHLSCTVKHPCSSVAVKAFMARSEFHADPRPAVRAFVEGLGRAWAPEAAAWVEPWLDRLRRIMADVPPP